MRQLVLYNNYGTSCRFRRDRIIEAKEKCYFPERYIVVAKKSKGAVIPEMDYPEHERTYENFIKLFKWSTIALIILMIFLAVAFL